MKQTSKEHEINRKAAGVYNLVKANRDEEAEALLRGYGPDAVAVANAMIAGEFHKTPAGRFASSVGSLILSLVAVWMTIMVYRWVGIPSAIDASCWYAWYLSLVLLFGVVGCISSLFIPEVIRKHVLARSYLDRVELIRHHSNEIASRALLAETSTAVELISAMGKACRERPAPSDNTRSLLIEALCRLLPLCTYDDLLELDRYEGGDLLGLLWHVETELAVAFSLYGDRPPHQPVRVAHTSQLGAAIIGAYEKIPNRSAIGWVRKISEAGKHELPSEWHRMIKAAKRCLPILEENVRRLEGKGVLLRPSNSTENCSEQLLRAHVAQGETPAEELLRTADETS